MDGPDPARDLPAGPAADLWEPVLRWYDGHARDLPWREPGASAWSVMVSEYMLQQTPVARVLPVHAAWLERWPRPADLAAEPTGEAVRAWGRLGYPRRALRLHAAAVAVTERHGGEVPASYDDLLALPGVGDYTAAAIATFAYGRRHVVLDTNVRRVHARVLAGQAVPAASVTRAERDRAAALLPPDAPTAATWSVAVMELGALVCTARSPDCDACPVAGTCAWRAAGHPAYDGPVRRAQAWDGTDRQCRGRLLAVLRDADAPVHLSRLDAAWPDPLQRARCLEGLLTDGLAVRTSDTTVALP
ncbi:A/G-specific adenine glycosylase [Nocardioides lentus]|uniref:Adenine DNA glycosylase n=1 Tax=Nocardioides lentus TaxID=338077 RepID=A0ABN2P8P5_9ACTN